ncbi:hypothetical protein SVIOM74S_08018 [Streptomyces violarus]
MTEQPTRKPFLYVVVCAAGIAADVSKLITAAQAAETGRSVSSPRPSP